MGKVRRTSAEIIEIAKQYNLINVDQFHCSSQGNTLSYNLT